MKPATWAAALAISLLLLIGSAGREKLLFYQPRAAQARALKFSMSKCRLATAIIACFLAVSKLPADNAHHAHLRCVSAADALVMPNSERWGTDSNPRRIRAASTARLATCRCSSTYV